MINQINIGMLVTAVLKLVLIIVLPIVMFTVPLTGIPIPGIWVTGVRMFLMGNMLIIIPVILYLLMALFSIGYMQKYSIWPAIAAIAIEVFLLFGAYLILQQGDIAFLLTLLPKEYNTYVQAGLIHLAKPGYGVVINLILSIAYIVFKLIFAGSSGRNSGGRSSGGGVGRANVNGMAGQRGRNIGGGINRPQI